MRRKWWASITWRKRRRNKKMNWWRKTIRKRRGRNKKEEYQMEKEDKE